MPLKSGGELRCSGRIGVPAPLVAFNFFSTETTGARLIELGRNGLRWSSHSKLSEIKENSLSKSRRNTINLDKTDIFKTRMSSNFNLIGIIRRSFETCNPTLLLFFCRVLLKIENYLLLTFSHYIRLLANDRIPCNANVGIKLSVHGAFLK